MEVINNRYQILDRIGRGGMGVVYKVRDRLTGNTLALKQVLIAPDRLQFASVSSESDSSLSLALEFRTLASLRHPHIVSVLDYGFVWDAPTASRLPFFTMQFIEGAIPITDYVAKRDQKEKIKILLNLLQTLTYLHRRGIIHRDLKPGNVLITAEGVLKVLDFGLAVSQAEAAVARGMSGTLLYMAPELLSECSSSVHSDLYAVGVIAYEMLIGQHPYNRESIRDLIMGIITIQPDVSALPEALGRVLARLLAKDPTARFEDAPAAIQALCEATDSPLPTEAPALRESFLQAATFIGREVEFKQLYDSLQGILTQKAALWLIGGESGVGKSRLLDELQTRALLAGCLVLRGQAVEGGVLPYQMWRTALPLLVLSSDISAIDAGILKEIIPDMDALLERAIPSVPELPGTPGRQRLASTIAHLFKQQAQPVVLILEDLHWAEEGFTLLTAILELAAERSLMVIGTYRDDERPDLPKQLPQMQHMKLARLTPEAMRALSISMLGDIGQKPHILQLLERETEGNVFFLVEVVRLLADRAGRLSDIASITLPHRVFATRIRDIVLRRLARVPEDVRAWLKVIAVLGRQVEMVVLEALDSTDLDARLTLCVNAAILETVQGQWRFIHDKIREGLLQEISQTEQGQFHRRAAEALEKAYREDKLWAEVIAMHWQKAEGYSDPHKEVHYTLLACEHHIYYTADYQRALLLLDRVAELSRNRADMDHERITLYKLLGDCHEKLSQYAQAQETLETGLAIARQRGDEHGQAEILRLLGQVAMRHGAFDAAITAQEQSLAFYRNVGDKSGIASILSNLGSIARQRGDYATARSYQLEGLALRREINDQLGISASYNRLGNLAYLQGDYEGARTYQELSLIIKRAISDKWGIAISLNNLASVCYSQKDFAAAREYGLSSLQIRKEIGDLNGVSSSLSFLGVVAEEMGEFILAKEYLDQSLDLKRQINDQLGLSETLVNRASVLEKLGARAAALRDFYDGLSLARQLNHMATFLDGLARVNRIWAAEEKWEQMAIWLTLLDRHPSLWDETRILQVTPLWALVRDKLTPEAIVAAVQKAETLQLDKLAAELLATWQPPPASPPTPHLAP